MNLINSEKILGEIRDALLSVDAATEEKIENEILEAKRVFCDGLGRSGLCCRAFAMRLMHLGITAYVVGETITPPIKGGDLLLICSGSGEAASLSVHAVEAKKKGAKIALITVDGGSALSEISDITLIINAKKKGRLAGEKTSILPLGSLFEDTVVLIFENMVLSIMENKQETNESMFNRHANLE